MSTEPIRRSEPGHVSRMPDRSLRTVIIETGGALIHGDLVVPSAPTGLVVFAHASGSGRDSPRNQHVARALNGAGLATLLVDLLSEQEEGIDAVTAHLRFDVRLLAHRLVATADFAAADPQLGALPVGLFGASTGAAVALVAAAQRPHAIAAVVSRGGRPDLASHALEQVRAATLFIVGGRDEPVRQLNETALARLERIASRLELVDGATHLFEEPGALDEVARRAGDWFARYLPRFRYLRHSARSR